MYVYKDTKMPFICKCLCIFPFFFLQHLKTKEFNLLLLLEKKNQKKLSGTCLEKIKFWLFNLKTQK